MKTLCTALCLLLLVSARAQTCTILCNGDFDSQTIGTSVTLTTAILCWQTTASDGKMEVWASGFNGVNSYNGIQHVELNATEAATMFQDFFVSVPAALGISFAHRGRAGNDTVEVSIGPMGGPYTTLGRYGDGTSAWGLHTASYQAGTGGTYRIRFTPVYWSGGNVALGNFLDAVSVTGPAHFPVTASSPSVCPGGTVVLSASGGTAYSWIGGPQTTTYLVAPQATTVYTVTGTNANGCSGAGTSTVTVNPAVIMATASKTVICRNAAPAVITASGGVTYLWSGGATTNTILSGNTATSTYTVTGTNANGCKASATVQVVVEPCTGIEIPGENEPGFFPNPARDLIHFSAPAPGWVTIMDLRGVQIKTVRVSEGMNTIALHDLTRGIYLVKSDCGSVVSRFRLVTAD